jgi:hypothetical protein
VRNKSLTALVARLAHININVGENATKDAPQSYEGMPFASLTYRFLGR